MATLSTLEKLKLEKLFDMSGGYVLDFHNRTFQEFFAENLHRDIYESKYEYGSGSKANRLRAFWNIEPNHIVAESHETFDKIVLVSGDGDYKLLIDFLVAESKLEKILFPDGSRASSLYKKLGASCFAALDNPDTRKKISMKKAP